MNKRYAAILGVLFVALSATTPTRAESESVVPIVEHAESDEPESVLVVGEQPGPGLWKVSKGEHVMWVLGVHAPLPKAMTWNSKHVESLIAESQELLLAGRVDIGADIGFFRGLTLLPALVRATKNPNDARLQDVLPADTYARWLPLKQKYIGDDTGVERLRPSVAAGKLSSAAMSKSGLVYGNSIEDKVRKIAKKNKVRIHRMPDIKRKAEVEDPRGMLKAARTAEFADAECFAQSLDNLESDLEALKVRANAWATGDLESLRRAGEANVANYCVKAFIDALKAGAFAELGEQTKAMFGGFDTQFKLASSELEREWLDAAEAALEKNRSTFAVLPIQTLLDEKGYLAKLREKGYAVEEPG